MSVNITIQETINEVDITVNQNVITVNVTRTTGGGEVESVTGDLVDNTDPLNPVVNAPFIPTKTSDLTNDGENGVDPFITLRDIPGNLVLYPTTVASDISGYFKMVTDIEDTDYNTTAVDVSTGAITTTNQLVSSLASSAGVLIGNPGIVNITVTGNIKRVSGSGTATFKYEVYKRNLAGAETLVSTSGDTLPVTLITYVEFFAISLLNDGTFLNTDRIVLKFYADRIAGGSNPTYNFQFGGVMPVRAIFPVPSVNLPKPNLSQVLAIQGRPMKLIDTSLGDYTFVAEDLAKTLYFYNTNTINAIIPDGLFNIDLGVELVGYVYGANVTIITDPNQNIDSTTIADFIMFRGSQIIQDRWLFALSSDSLGGSVSPADLNATLLVGNISNESIKLGTTSDRRTDLSKDAIVINYYGDTANQNAFAFSLADEGFNNTTTLYNGQLSINHVPTDDLTILALNQLLFQKYSIGKSLKIGETTLGSAIYELPDKDYNSGIPYVLATNDDLTAVNTALDLKVDKTSWVDYSASSTVVGWSSFTTKKISYKIIDDAMIVDFKLEGTSNATTISFTIPFNAASTTFVLSAYIINNNSTSNLPGRIDSVVGSNVINILRDSQNTVFSTFGTKKCSGQIIIQL